LAEELLYTFGLDLGAVTLEPGAGGVFEVSVDGNLIFSMDREGRFPTLDDVKPKIPVGQ
jgi:selenoprotein W-related protein